MTPRPSISVITATLNCATPLRRLTQSLRLQQDQDFDWIVVDGGSTDETPGIVSQFPGNRLTMISQPDFGVYDALNRAVALTRSDYYIVVGADDELYPQAIAKYREAATRTGCDIIAARVESAGTLLEPMRGKRYLRGGNAFVASHSVGAMIRRGLHDLCGYYSNRYVNCADMHFILRAVDKGHARIAAADFVAGRFDSGGISSADAVCSLSDAFRIQLYFGENKLLQLSLYTARLIRALWFR